MVFRGRGSSWEGEGRRSSLSQWRPSCRGGRVLRRHNGDNYASDCEIRGADAPAKLIGRQLCLQQAMRKKKSELRLAGRVGVGLTAGRPDWTGINQINEADCMTVKSEEKEFIDIAKVLLERQLQSVESDNTEYEYGVDQSTAFSVLTLKQFRD